MKGTYCNLKMDKDVQKVFIMITFHANKTKKFNSKIKVC